MDSAGERVPDYSDAETWDRLRRVGRVVARVPGLAVRAMGAAVVVALYGPAWCAAAAVGLVYRGAVAGWQDVREFANRESRGE